MALNNREIALAICLVGGLLIGLRNLGIRKSIVNLLRAVATPWMLGLWVLMAAYVSLEVDALGQVDLWHSSHLKDTLLWAITTGVVILVRVAPGDMATFRKVARETFAASVVIDFVANLYAFPLIVELILQPLIVVLLMIQAFAERKPQYEVVHRGTTTALGALGAILALYVAASIYANWDSFATIDTAKDFLVPIALSLLFMPFVYFARLYAAYERFLARLRFYVPRPDLRRKLRRRAILRCHISASALEALEHRLRANQINTDTDLLVLFHGGERLTSEPPDGYRRLNWGDPPTEELSLAQPSGSDLTSYTPQNYLPFLGLPILDEVYSFTNGRLYQAQCWVYGEERRDEARVRISALYGPPTFANEYLQIWKWTWPNSKIWIQLRFERKFNRAEILFSNGAI